MVPSYNYRRDTSHSRARRCVWLAVAAFVAFATSSAEAANGFSFTTIDAPGSSSTFAMGINASGQIVGGFADSQGTHGFLLSGGSFTTINPPGGSTPAFTFASGINDGGQIVGDLTANGPGYLLSGGQ